MAYALVGTIGVASQGAVSTAVTPAWGTSENRTSGNLLICFYGATGSGVTGAISTPAGWTGIQTSNVGTSCGACLFYKIASGADAAPTLTAITNGIIAAQLAEFSGNSATPLDQQAGAVSPSSPILNGSGSPDAATGELLVVSGADFRSASRSPNDTWTSNNATITQAGSNNGVSSANHYSFGYSLGTTAIGSGTTTTMTCSVTTSLTGLSVAMATLKLAPLVIMPDLTTEPIVPPRYFFR